MSVSYAKFCEISFEYKKKNLGIKNGVLEISDLDSLLHTGKTSDLEGLQWCGIFMYTGALRFNKKAALAYSKAESG